MREMKEKTQSVKSSKTRHDMTRHDMTLTTYTDELFEKVAFVRVVEKIVAHFPCCRKDSVLRSNVGTRIGLNGLRMTRHDDEIIQRQKEKREKKKIRTKFPSCSEPTGGSTIDRAFTGAPNGIRLVSAKNKNQRQLQTNQQSSQQQLNLFDHKNDKWQLLQLP